MILLYSLATLLWFLFSGHLEPFFLILAFISVGSTVLLYRFFHQVIFLRTGFRRLFFWLRMPFFIIKSGVRLLFLLLRFQPIQPQTIVVDVQELGASDQINLLFAITLTPGTIATHLEHNKMHVSAIFADDIEDLKQKTLCKTIQGL